MRTPKDYDSHKPTWCPGCGDFAVLAALKKAVASLDIDPKDLAVITGIGCSSKINAFIKCYGFHGVHGRLLPVATAVKLVNPKLTVIAAGGDGDGYAIGMAHFMHTIRRNPDITYIVMNNQVYGLTKGQTSPTSLLGFVTGSTPYGSKEQPIDGVTLALSAGASFVARGFSGNAGHLAKLVEEGIKHRGFALIDVLTPCVTFNKVNTYDWYRENVVYLDGDPSYDPSSRVAALERVMTSNKIPLGIIFKEEKPVLEEQLLFDLERPIVFQDLSDKVGDLEGLQEVFV